MTFFFSKNVFKCRNCIPATPKHTKRERKLNHAIFEFVARFRFCISSSLRRQNSSYYNHKSRFKNITRFKEKRLDIGVFRKTRKHKKEKLSLPVSEIKHLFMNRVNGFNQLLYLKFHDLGINEYNTEEA